MATRTRTLQDLLDRAYRLNVIADPDGGYVVEFPDLAGCVTQIDTLAELAERADEARELWITSAFEQGLAVPEPTYPEELSGRFNVRLPKSLHRALVDLSAEEGVSLNQLVVYLLSTGVARSTAERAAGDVALHGPVSAKRRGSKAA
jgi:antitoxin HicB